MGGLLITGQPQAKLEEVEVKESSGEEKEIMGSRSRSRDGGMVVIDNGNIRERRRVEWRSQEVSTSNQRIYCFCY